MQLLDRLIMKLQSYLGAPAAEDALPVRDIVECENQFAKCLLMKTRLRNDSLSNRASDNFQQVSLLCECPVVQLSCYRLKRRRVVRR